MVWLCCLNGSSMRWEQTIGTPPGVRQPAAWDGYGFTSVRLSRGLPSAGCRRLPAQKGRGPGGKPGPLS
jgi:hypothetical protein